MGFSLHAIFVIPCMFDLHFTVSETCDNWFGLVNICAYYARQTHEIY